MKIESQVQEIAWKPSTLVWDMEDLVDVTNGQRVKKDGSLTRPSFFLGHPFNGAVALRSNEHFWAVVYERRGTKAVLFKDWKIVRELNRSYYHAKVYEYPLALCIAPTGNVVLVHCPREFNVLDIEDAETGERIASAKTQMMEFHSRLSLSPDGRSMIDAGWFWHPWCGLWVFDIANALTAPASFGEKSIFHDRTDVCSYEIDSACFLDSDRLVVSSNTDNLGDDDLSPDGLGPKQIGLWSIKEHRWLSKANLAELTGSIVAWKSYVISFYKHPKLIDVNTGEVLYRWEQISSGNHTGAVSLEDPALPSIAVDSEHGRFAVASSNGVSIVSLYAD